MYLELEAIGYLSAAPELRYTDTGTAVTNFSMAVNRKWTSNGEKQEEVTWLRVSVWGKQGEAVEKYLGKGSKVFIKGRLRPDPETGNPRTFKRNDGSPGASFEITAYKVIFLDSKGEKKENYNPESENFEW